jgi:hypothetical protein
MCEVLVAYITVLYLVAYVTVLYLVAYITVLYLVAYITVLYLVAYITVLYLVAYVTVLYLRVNQFSCRNINPAVKRNFCIQSLSDSLRAGRSGDRIPIGERFSAPVQTGPVAQPASYIMGTGSFCRG